ncbi:MAG: nitrate reductase associated protein [Jaaginema sp. PMC 1079.18]|nr:nitrate reductase associated protein [Jaaginema sp. PMC 1080.18]MEC4849500.1 nitrate reductase associated protein [Jaaginema sp. PMC 1079.18]MEC4865621.1 nitrate reductase associated protein [Jaaginema sp. PMC 1078.18]
MTYFFDFETDFIESLRCIPMRVRMKLDTCGVKLKLTHWHQFNRSERQSLVELACENSLEIENYRQYLQSLVIKYTGEPAAELQTENNPPWLNETDVPDTVREKARSHHLNITQKQWQSLTPAQRFALIKLSRPSHENRNFVPAMQEFNLLEETTSLPETIEK